MGTALRLLTKKPIVYHNTVVLMLFTGLYFFLKHSWFYRFLVVEQDSFFAYLPSSFKSLWAYPGGFSEYMGQFLAQSFRIPGCGALILVILLFCIFMQTRALILQYRKLDFNVATVLAFIPIAFLLFLFVSPFYQLTEYAALLFVLSSALLYTLVKKEFLRFPIGLVFIALCYLFGGPFVYLFLALVIAYEFISSKRKPGLKAAAFLTFTALLLYLSRFYFFHITSVETCWPLWPNNPSRQFLEFDFVFADAILLALFAFFLLLPCLVLLLASFINSRKAILIFVATGSLVMLSFFIFFAGKVYSSDQKLFEKINYLAEHEKWDEVWEMCSDYFGSEKADAEGYYPYGIHEYAKLAALMTNNIAENYTKLLHLPGFSTLFFQPPSDYQHLLFNHFQSDLYYNMGLMTSARQMSLNLIESFGMTNRSLRRVNACNVILDNMSFNQKYGYILSHTPNNKTFLSELLNDSAYIQTKRELLPKANITDTYIPDILILELAEKAPGNSYAFEYACMLNLLYFKDETYLLNNLHRFKELDYIHIPTFFEEALIISEMKDMDDFASVSNIRNKTFGGYTIREETVSRCEKFFERTMQGFGNISSMEKQFGDTYYFHKYFRQIDL